MIKIQSNVFSRSMMALAGALAIGSAQAQTVLDFTASGSTTSTYGDEILTDFILTLSSVNGMAASSFGVSQGDTIDSTISFSPTPSVSIPSNPQFTVAYMSLTGSGFDGSTTGSSNGSESATLGGMSAGGAPYQSCTTSYSICDPGLYIAPGSQSTFSLDTYKTTYTVSALNNPVTISEADFYVISVVSAVPEPQTYALMAVGLGMLWFVVRRRKGLASMGLARAA